MKGFCVMKKALGVALFSSLFAASVLAQTAPASAAPATPAKKPVATNPAPAKQSNAKANQVWVNGMVYHCPGTRYYGNTKSGEYMTEQAAIAAGAHASHNRPCAK